jgi:hypothetical protein
MSHDKDPISRIEEAFGKTRLVGWQLAADGNWAGAERVFLENSPDWAAGQVQRWLDRQVTDNVAIEALLEFVGGERFFFGVRITHLQPEEKSRVIRALLTDCQNAGSLRHVVQRARDTLGEQQLACNTPDYLELGVFDLWNEVKPLVVWRKDEKLGEAIAILLPEEMKDKTQKPDTGFSPLHQPQAKPLMLEACWKKDENGCGFSCWLGLPVGDSGKMSNRHRLSNDRYLSAATIFIGSSPV